MAQLPSVKSTEKMKDTKQDAVDDSERAEDTASRPEAGEDSSSHNEATRSQSPQEAEDSVESSRSPSEGANSRLDRFKALRKRATDSAKANRKEVFDEFKRSTGSRKNQTKLQRQKEQAEFELEKLEAAEKGEDFERRRAWDWTVEESEKWDEKMKRKQESKEGATFSDHSSAAEKAYLKDLRSFNPDLDAYAKDKFEKLGAKARLLELEDGSVIAYDEGQAALTGAGDFATGKPSAESVDRLLDSLKKGDEQRMKRRKKDEDGQVTYINEKNKHFNQKLERHYDKYTKEVRDSFERGTAL